MANLRERSLHATNHVTQINLRHLCHSYSHLRHCLCASMLPTMSISGDVILVDRLSPRFGEIVPGDIVIVRSPENPRKVITKRLIAREDDSVTFLVDPKNSDQSKTVVVPKGHVWVQGDNIYDSRDSRAFGPVPYGLLYGKVFWRVWPIKDFGPL
ncbi:hypothetical protein RND81_07G161400 [Saponaria officinalis]|uniref:Peptidase S26 domain-containing protein n=1 Tax=Saponaria officinalis TaxID=3572 RepID=A0AAW1JNZ5_SAPOF